MPDARPRFCTACGAPLMPGDAFCTACGTRAAEAPSPVVPAAYAPQPTPAPQPAPAAYAPAQAPAPAPTPSGERILAVVGNLTQVGGFMGMKQKTFSLIITDRRLIFAELTKEKITAMVNEARDAAKAEGKGFFGQWGAQLGTSFNYHQAYWQMAPEAALAETPGNFAIERPAFRGAKFKVGATYDDGRNEPDELVIKHDGGKLTFRVNGSLGGLKDTFRETGLV